MSPMAKVRGATPAMVAVSLARGRQLPHDRERLSTCAPGAELGDEDVPHDPLAVDDEGGPPGEEAEGGLDAEERADLAVGVAEERHRQLVLAGEALVRVERVGADADDLGPGLDEGVVAVAEAAGLDGAAGGVVLRIEEDDDALVGVELREGDGLAARRRAG